MKNTCISSHETGRQQDDKARSYCSPGRGRGGGGRRHGRGGRRRGGTWHDVDLELHAAGAGGGAVARETADEVAGADGRKGDVGEKAGAQGGDGAGGVAGVVVDLADLEHVVRPWLVPEDELVARVELPGGRPAAVIGGEVPRAARLAHAVGRR